MRCGAAIGSVVADKGFHLECQRVWRGPRLLPKKKVTLTSIVVTTEVQTFDQPSPVAMSLGTRH